MKAWIAWGLAAGLCGCASPPPADPALDRLVARMTGRFDSSAQAAAQSGYFDIRLSMVPLWTERTDGRWLYVEQATATAPDRPYRQRIYRVARRGDAFVSEVYTLPDPAAWAGRASDPVALRALAADLTPQQLSRRAGCDVLLRALPDGDFDGGTQGQTCASDPRGAAYATSTVRVKADRLETWDQGFDAQGRQVWGATQGGYVFVRRAGAQP